MHFADPWIEIVVALAAGFVIVHVIRVLTRSKDPEERARFTMWSNDPGNWKFGLFYFNPKDHRLFPPKRMAAFGWTVNFGNPMSVLALVLLIVALLSFHK